MTTSLLRPQTSSSSLSREAKLNAAFSSRLRQSSEESLLSKSLNTANIYSRSASEIKSITHSGYLLKRSNDPYRGEVKPFPGASDLQDDENTTAVLLPRLEPRVGERSGYPTFPTLPQHESAQPKELPEEAKEENDGKAPLEKILGDLSSFFGLRPQHEEKKEDIGEPDESELKWQNDDSTRSTEQSEPPLLSPPKTRSAPISVKSPNGSGYPRRSSAPSRPSSFDYDYQEDAIDPKDGHIWRSKYCVLEDGILYFYRNAADGDSPEAQAERQHSTLLEALEDESQWMYGDLSKSPMPRTKISPLASRLAKQANSADSGVLWEKRVALDCVGAVRSAEQEYGEFSFELVAVQDDVMNDEEGKREWPSDKLVLRAQDSEDMNEWLFQFHRSLYLFMENIVKAVGLVDGKLCIDIPTMLPAAGDIHYPSSQYRYVPPPAASKDLMHVISPRVKRLSPSSLSHGHGRSTLHRRRESLRRRDSDLTPRGPSPSQEIQKSLSEPISRVTPGTVERVDRDEREPAATFDLELSPEMTSPPATFPEMERPKPVDMSGKYVPPHLRNRSANGDSAARYMPPHLRRQTESNDSGAKSPFMSLEQRAAETPRPGQANAAEIGVFEMSDDHEPVVEPLQRSNLSSLNDRNRKPTPFKLGGCADPSVVDGSVVDPRFTKREDSKVGQVHTNGYGAFGGGVKSSTTGLHSLQWEIGAVSQCGVPKNNQDSYLVANDLLHAFDSFLVNSEDAADSKLWQGPDGHLPGLFAVFDGHAGDQAARYAAEKLLHFLLNESRDSLQGNIENVEHVLRKAIAKLDHAFCRLCKEDGRDWESGSTALIALVVHDHLVLANLGDCRGVMCKSVRSSDGEKSRLLRKGWSQLDLDDGESNSTREKKWIRATGDESFEEGDVRVFYKEMTDIHSPSRIDEHERIVEARGWITSEKEIPCAQLQRLDLCDEYVLEILKRCFSDRYHGSQTSTSPKRFSSAPSRILQISRVCGELTVSRALGDHDFKSSFNDLSSHSSSDESDGVMWDGPPFFPYPDTHNRQFKGDLVSSIPEVQTHRIAEEGVSDEFLLLACDGLWDVMDPDDAIRVTRSWLFEKKWTAKEAAARLAQLGIHLGSSDNITVIIVRFFTGPQNEESE